jgi:hypothetical protein
LACHLQINAEPDPKPDSAYHFDLDPDPAYHYDLDPNPIFQFDAGPSGRIPNTGSKADVVILVMLFSERGFRPSFL